MGKNCTPCQIVNETIKANQTVFNFKLHSFQKIEQHNLTKYGHIIVTTQSKQSRQFLFASFSSTHMKKLPFYRMWMGKYSFFHTWMNIWMTFRPSSGKIAQLLWVEQLFRPIMSIIFPRFWAQTLMQNTFSSQRMGSNILSILNALRLIMPNNLKWQMRRFV